MSHTPAARKNLKLALLAGTCLTSAAAIPAATVVESTDFADNLGDALLAPLPVGTDIVTGNVTTSSDVDDFVAFTSLLPGGAFALTLISAGFFDFSSLDSGGLRLGIPDSTQNGVDNAIFTGTVPSDGKIVAQVNYNEGNPYTISLTAATVPEPSTAALAGLALTAAATRRRKRRNPKAE